MKNFSKISLVVIIISLFTVVTATAQNPVYDVVSISPGYTNQSFYSLQNGEISNIDNADWDLAFQISGFEASILINSKNNVRLFKAGLDVNAWSSVSANDTVGVLNSANELYNQDTSWWAGAFNITNDTANQFDLGWGVYDFVTHVVLGDSLYFLQLPSGNVKKLWIQSLQNGIYNFAYADVDGSNEVITSLNKLDYPDKNFGYYSIQNDSASDREPNKYLWDLTFCQYMSTSPILYKVTGVLANDSVTTFKAYPVDVNTVTPWGGAFTYHINEIGYSWKNYDFNSNSWAIEDSLVYFVNDKNGGLWKLVFTGFGGAATGDYEFYKEQISATGLDENEVPRILGVYPNPATGFTNLVINLPETNRNSYAALFDITGKLVKTIPIVSAAGIQNVRLDLSGLSPALYCLKVVNGNEITSQRIVVAEN